MPEVVSIHGSHVSIELPIRAVFAKVWCGCSNPQGTSSRRRNRKSEELHQTEAWVSRIASRNGRRTNSETDVGRITDGRWSRDLSYTRGEGPVESKWNRKNYVKPEVGMKLWHVPVRVYKFFLHRPTTNDRMTD